MAEETKLKMKINALIDRITEQEKEISEKNMRIQLLQGEIEMLQIRDNSSGAKGVVAADEENIILTFVKDFCLVAQRILSNKDYIDYNYTTKNSEFFYKIEKGIFDNYICENASLDLKTFLKFCVDLALVKSEKNRKCVYNSGEIKVYYVSRPFMNAVLGQGQIQEA